MEDDESREDLSQWEEVQFPWNTEPLRTDNRETNSPPSSSSSSPTPPPESPLPQISPSPSTSSSTNLKAVRDEEAQRRPSRRGSEIVTRLRILSAEARRVVSKALVAGKFWSIASATVALLIGVIYRRWRRRALGVPRYHHKERLVLLLREKDEKIGQLMIRIAEMNEALSAQRRVPVIRVG